MTDTHPAQLWTRRASFVLLATAIVFFHLLPLDTSTRSWVGPDLLFAFAVAWAVRRPDYVPVVLLAVLFLLADFLLQRPPGLWALLTLIGVESIKAKRHILRDGTFINEWLSFAGAVIAIAIANRLLLVVLLVPVPKMTPILFETGATVIIYPLIVFITHALMRVRKVAHGDLDGFRQRA